MTPEAVVIESMFRLVNKQSEDVDFKLNTAQRVIDEQWQRRMIHPKARQEGVSTYYLARNTVKCLGVRNTRAVVISHNAESTERMLLKVKYFLENIKGPAPVIRNNSKNEITFPKTNSMFYIGTAGSRAFGRGDTITDLHCSEVAYWPNPKGTMQGLLQAVPATGCVSIESTGNGAGNWYHSLCMRASKGQSQYRMVFLSWHEFPEYTMPLSIDEAHGIIEHLREDLEEQELMMKYGLTPGQIAWRRMKIEDECDSDLHVWNKEYPSCLDDCFQVAGGGVFQQVTYVKTPDWIKDEQFFWRLKQHPLPDKHYLVGGDVGGGVGIDSSVAEIFCLETGEQVGEYINNRINPDEFAVELAKLGHQFNEAYLGIESNNHGIVTLKELTAHDYTTGKVRYPSSKIYRTQKVVRKKGRDEVRRLVDLGVRTTANSKPLIIGKLRTKLKGGVVIHSEILKNELSTFVQHEDGTMGAIENCFDDTVMAAGMAWFVEDRGALQLLDNPVTADEIVQRPDPFALDSIIAEMTGRRDKSFFRIRAVK